MPRNAHWFERAHDGGPMMGACYGDLFDIESYCGIYFLYLKDWCSSGIHKAMFKIGRSKFSRMRLRSYLAAYPDAELLWFQVTRLGTLNVLEKRAKAAIERSVGDMDHVWKANEYITIPYKDTPVFIERVVRSMQGNIPCEV